MRKLILPAIISCLLTTPLVWAEEDAEAAAEIQAPAAQTEPAAKTEPAQPEMTPPEGMEALMEKRMAHRKAMREKMRAIMTTEDREERQRLIEEQQAAIEAHRQEMQALMEEHDLMPPRGYPRYGQGYGYPHRGYDPRQRMPQYDMPPQYPMPPMMRDYPSYDEGYHGAPPHPRKPAKSTCKHHSKKHREEMKKMKMAHMKKMESLMQELVDLMKKQVADK